MDCERFSEGACAIGRALTRVGDAWSALVLRDAGQGLTRFDQFRQSLGIAPNILSRRLAALTEAGLLERRRYCEHPPRDEYVLTESGRDFLPILAAMAAWERRHRPCPTLVRMVDRQTGAEIEPVVVDRTTGRPLAEIETDLV